MWLFMSWLEERVDPSVHPQRGLYAASTLSGLSSFLSDWPALRDTHRVQSVPAHKQDYLPAWKACKINHKIHGHGPFLTSTLGDRKTHMIALGQLCSKLVQSLMNHDKSCGLVHNRKCSNKHNDTYWTSQNIQIYNFSTRKSFFFSRKCLWHANPNLNSLLN